MKNLYLLRHAHAASGTQDIERRLSLTGLAQISELKNYIKENNIHFDKIFCSPAVRTKQTINKLTDNAPIEIVEGLYSNGIDTYFEIIESISDQYNSVIIVGHNPTISEFMLSFDLTLETLKPADLVTLKSETWKDFKENKVTLIDIFPHNEKLY